MCGHDPLVPLNISMKQITTAAEYCDLFDITLELQMMARTLERHDFQEAELMRALSHQIQRTLENNSDSVTDDDILKERMERSDI